MPLVRSVVLTLLAAAALSVAPAASADIYYPYRGHSPQGGVAWTEDATGTAVRILNFRFSSRCGKVYVPEMVLRPNISFRFVKPRWGVKVHGTYNGDPRDSQGTFEVNLANGCRTGVVHWAARRGHRYEF
jgi:hypothetical protein